MAWYDAATDHVTVLTKTIYDSLMTYVRNHKAEHITGGVDPIPVATQTKTGLCPILDGVTTHYLDGSGNWATPPATVTNVTGSAPIVSSGGTTPAISISAATTGAAGSMSSADKTKLDGIESLADVTDAGNVNTAGAVMETDYNAFTVLAADTDNTPAPLTVGASTIVGRKSSGGIVALTAAEANTILGDVLKTDYDAFTVLAADTDNTPAALTVGASTVVGRKSSGGIVALTAAETRTILNVADGANAYVHPNHSGDVTSVADGAQTIAAKAVTLAKMNDMATASLIGRSTAGTGAPEVLSAATARTLLNVADGSQACSAANVNTAGAVMETDYDAYSILAATADHTPIPVSVPASTILGRKATGSIVAMYPSEVNDLLGSGSGSISGSRTLNLSAYNAILPDTNAATLSQVELATPSFFPLPVAAFTYGGSERLCWISHMPSNWDGLSITAQIEFTEAASSDSDVTWSLYSYRVDESENYNVTYGAVSSLTKTLVLATQNTKQLTNAGTITIGGSGDTILWELKRATDTYADTAYFVSLNIDYLVT